MRLLEFVPCGRRGALLHEDDEVDAAALPTAAPRRTEETEPMPPQPRVVSSDEKRRRRSSAGTTASGSWRPSLGAISENGDVAMTATTTTTPGAAKVAERRGVRQAVKTPARPKPAAARTGARSDTEDIRFRHCAVPSFAPTAFLF